MYKQYKRKGLSEMTPWIEEFDMTNVSVSEADLQNGSPKQGDMIARNPKNYEDKWLVAEKYFNDNLELVETELVEPEKEITPVMQRVIVEYNDLYDKTKKLFDFTTNTENLKMVGQIQFDLLNIQYGAMWTYLKTLETRLKESGIAVNNTL